MKNVWLLDLETGRRFPDATKETLSAYVRERLSIPRLMESLIIENDMRGFYLPPENRNGNVYSNFQINRNFQIIEYYVPPYPIGFIR